MPLPDERKLLKRACDWDNQEQAIAFVLQTWGSSPRPVGSLMLINALGEFEGSVSGGCVENMVISESSDVIQSGTPKRLTYGVSDESAWEVGLPCGGTIEVLILKVPDSQFSNLLLNHMPVTLAADITNGNIGLCTESVWLGSLDLQPELQELSLAALESGRTHIETIGKKQIFLRPFARPWRLMIVGAVHIAQQLAAIAQDTEFDVIIIDPRRSYATDGRFPSVQLVHDWPDTALLSLSLDHRSAVVTLSHDPKIDDPALDAALRSRAFYIGALGSQRNHQGRLKRLQSTHKNSAELARIRSPVGLDIGGNQPNEIAISILAEIIAVRNGKSLDVISH